MSLGVIFGTCGHQFRNLFSNAFQAQFQHRCRPILRWCLLHVLNVLGVILQHGRYVKNVKTQWLFLNDSSRFRGRFGHDFLMFLGYPFQDRCLIALGSLLGSILGPFGDRFGLQNRPWKRQARKIHVSIGFGSILAAFWMSLGPQDRFLEVSGKGLGPQDSVTFVPLQVYIYQKK